MNLPAILCDKCSYWHLGGEACPHCALAPRAIAVEPPVVQPPVDNSAERKTAPIGSGVLDYFPAALWEVAKISYWGNEKHNPGEPLHDARGKSTDDVDCLLRHLAERGTWDTIITKDGRTAKVRHSAAVAWRALRLLQRECEAEGAPIARGAKP